MSCKSCGGNGAPQIEALPLSSTPVAATTCSSCSQPRASCSCQAFCEEDHTLRIVQQRYGFTLRTTTAFVWPSVGEQVTLLTSGVDRLGIGSILWNPNGGYLTVKSFDFVTQTVVAENEDNPCNIYTGGETLPECTDFVVGPPACNTGSTPIPDIPYLAADFISPGNGECQLAIVTNITGLTVEDIVSVNGYHYRIGDIIDSGTIELCNDGEGAPEGTVIPWDDDGDDTPNIPVVVLSSQNPCTRDGTSAGVILVCDGADISRPLVGSVGGQIPVWNSITQRFELKNISSPYTVCTALTADLIVDPIHVGSYIITVLDTSEFTAGDSIVIDGVFYTVDTVDDSTTMHITPTITPGAIVTYPEGTPVCLDINSNRSLSGNTATLLTELAPAVGTVTLETTPISFTINNTSSVHTMHVLLNYIAHFSYGTAAGGVFDYDILESVNAGAYASVWNPQPQRGIDFLENAVTWIKSVTEVLPRTIAPGGSLVVAMKAKLIATPINPADPPLLYAYITAKLRHLSVAV